MLNPNFINWDEVFATSWNDANENVKNEKKFKMMAEVLVPDMVPSAMIAGIVCQNPRVCKKVARLLNNSINISWNSSLFFNVSNDTTANQKREAYERQKGICPICGEHFDFDEMEGDHIIPWSKGGKTTSDNCQMLCRNCNRKKQNI